MTYATQQDIIDRHGADALYVADRDGDGVIDADAVAQALTDASAEIDTYIGARYPLPLDETPSILRGKACDIALYRLASARSAQSEEQRTRYEDAIDLLKAIAKGSATLPITVPEGEEPSSPRPVVQEGPERLFSREKTRGL